MWQRVLNKSSVSRLGSVVESWKGSWLWAGKLGGLDHGSEEQTIAHYAYSSLTPVLCRVYYRTW